MKTRGRRGEPFTNILTSGTQIRAIEQFYLPTSFAANPHESAVNLGGYGGYLGLTNQRKKYSEVDKYKSRLIALIALALLEAALLSNLARTRRRYRRSLRDDDADRALRA
jgi:hypothetical protein